MKLEFKGRRVLIAGGSCEMSLRLAGLLVGEGLYPILTWRSEQGRGKIVDRLKEFEGSFNTAYLDLSSAESVERLFSQMEEGPDYLVDFAQGDFESLVGSADTELAGRYFTENVSTRADLIKRAARAMLKKRHGRMVFISSAAAGRSNPGQGFYAAAKLASEALYRSVGVEMAGRGITSVTLRPGYVDSGRGARYIEAHQGAVAGTPIGRPIDPGEVARAVLFFLSDCAAAFNAVEICMDGGLTAVK